MININKKFIILVVLSYIFALFSGGEFPYSIFYSLLIIFLMGLIFLRRSKEMVSARIRNEHYKYSVGEEESFSITIENDRSLVMPYVMIYNKTFGLLSDNYKGDMLYLDFNANEVLRNNIIFKKRGTYNIGDIELTINDIFSLFTVKKHITDEVNIKVYPKIYKLDEITLAISNNYENTVKSNKGVEDISLIKDIRKYKTGDNLKKIHWKLSAKHNELYVKNFENVSGRECNLFLNLSEENNREEFSREREEYMVDFYISFIKAMIDRDVKCNLFINCIESMSYTVENSYDFEEVIEALTLQQSDGTMMLSSFINSNLKYIGSRSWVGIVTINVDELTRNALINLKDVGYKVSLFYCTEKLADVENINYLSNIGVECINFMGLLNKL